MTTENSFNASAESVNEGMEKGVKWMQDVNRKFIEAQKQQIKQAAEMVNSVNNTNIFPNIDKLKNPFSDSIKEFAKLYQKNVRFATDMFVTSLKPVTESVSFSVFSDQEAITKEMGVQMERLNNQVLELTTLNQKNLDLLVKLFDKTSKSLTPDADSFGKELENAFEATKATMEEISRSYTDFLAPSTELMKEALEKLKVQVTAAIDENVKFWAEFLDKNTTSSKKKSAKVKVDKGLVNAAAKTKKSIPNMN